MGWDITCSMRQSATSSHRTDAPAGASTFLLLVPNWRTSTQVHKGLCAELPQGRES